jgi:uncharacterized membrane protein YcaP (DUF421 family)
MASMWRDMFIIQVPVLEKIIRTIAVYTILALLFRLVGKRGLASLNTFDFVVMFLLSNVVQNAVIGPDDSLLGGIVGAVTLVAVNAAVNRWLAASPLAERILEGTSTAVIVDGQPQRTTLRRLAIRPDELDQAVRLQNGDDITQVADGRLEPSGHLVLTLKPEEQGATKSDIQRLHERLAAIESTLDQLARPRGIAQNPPHDGNLRGGR